MSERRVELIRREDGAFMEATLLDGLVPEDLLLVERVWGPERLRLLEELLRRGTPRPEHPESLHWDWRKKAPELKLLEARGFAIVCQDEWQGAMLLRTASHFVKLEANRGKPLVYGDYIETAPWNWRVRALGRESRFRGVGSILFREAVRESLRQGFHGRLGLHALPQAEPFYEKAGMTRVGADLNKQNLVYFEFTREQARRFLDDRGAR